MHCIYTIILIKHIKLSKRSTRNPLAEGIHKETLRKKKIPLQAAELFSKKPTIFAALHINIIPVPVTMNRKIKKPPFKINFRWPQ